MVTTLSKLVEMTQGQAVPEWVRNAVRDQRDKIIRGLAQDGRYTLEGPNGETVVIQTEERVAAAV